MTLDDEKWARHQEAMYQFHTPELPNAPETHHTTEANPWIERREEIRKNPPKIGEYLLYHYTEIHPPKIVYVETVNEAMEMAGVRVLGEHLINLEDWSCLERPTDTQAIYGLLRHGNSGISYVPFNQGNRIIKQRRFFEFRDGKCFLNTHDTLEQLVVFSVVLAEFIILQSREQAAE